MISTFCDGVLVHSRAGVAFEALPGDFKPAAYAGDAGFDSVLFQWRRNDRSVCAMREPFRSRMRI
ncbi:MAG: hypothetical protein ACLR0N_16120 [Bilophila wadsworthia]